MPAHSCTELEEMDTAGGTCYNVQMDTCMQEYGSGEEGFEVGTKLENSPNPEINPTHSATDSPNCDNNSQERTKKGAKPQMWSDSTTKEA